MPDNTTILQRVATKAVIMNSDGKVLILREASSYEEGSNAGRYHLPGGRLEIGEPFEMGLKREVFEETGLKIEIGPPIYVGEWRPVIKGVANQIVGIYFLCSYSGSEVELSEEHDSYEWVFPRDAHLYEIMAPEDKVIAAIPK